MLYVEIHLSLFLARSLERDLQQLEKVLQNIRFHATAVTLKMDFPSGPFPGVSETQWKQLLDLFEQTVGRQYRFIEQVYSGLVVAGRRFVVFSKVTKGQ